ncbi:MAG: NAD(+) diphosphatase [Deltaproteobacteria bacterium]|nr:NAD(+) diphosphatase [Deltaproteobacteria bacterium]
MKTDHRARSRRNMFADSCVDRAHARRADLEWLAARLADSASRLTFLWRSKHLVTSGELPKPAFRPPAGLGHLFEASPPMLLGLEGESAWFAVELPADVPPPEEVLAWGEFRDLRELGPLLSPGEAGLLAQVRGLAHWHTRNRFCGDCGAPTESRHAGHVRACTNPACGKEHFPRTDPAIIVLVTFRGRCLLGRQPVWPPERYSTIAGFVEPGETLEEAVAREVEEETGVVVGAVRYHSSQPWPFPASLMLGFTAEALSDTIRLDDELEDARWFTRRQLRDAVAAGTVRLAPPISIAYRLIESWYDGTGKPRLSEIVGEGW